MASQPIIGVDFDNTIVCYDDVFHRVALERSLIPSDLPQSKSAVRDYLKSLDREDDWTELQGIVYGSRMLDAAAYPGVKEFFKQARDRGYALRIISHKTRYPIRGEQFDLHRSAEEWLSANGFFDAAQIGLDEGAVFFELTRQAKLARIAETGCAIFIDDLPEVLGEPGFPSGVEKFLFDPGGIYSGSAFRTISSWDDAALKILPSACVGER